jgi:hypothetical protein
MRSSRAHTLAEFSRCKMNTSSAAHLTNATVGGFTNVIGVARECRCAHSTRQTLDYQSLQCTRLHILWSRRTLRVAGDLPCNAADTATLAKSLADHQVVNAEAVLIAAALCQHRCVKALVGKSDVICVCAGRCLFFILTPLLTEGVFQIYNLVRNTGFCSFWRVRFASPPASNCRDHRCCGC